MDSLTNDHKENTSNGEIGKLTTRRPYEWTNRQKDKSTNRQMDRLVVIGQMDNCINR